MPDLTNSAPDPRLAAMQIPTFKSVPQKPKADAPAKSPAKEPATHQSPTPGELAEALAAHSIHNIGKPWNQLAPREQLQVISLVVRDRAVTTAVQTEKRYTDHRAKRAHYLSLECLIGRLLRNNLVNLGLYDHCRAAVASLGGDLDSLTELESDAGLGNGGLGRLAACLLDSMATLAMPGFGYCLNYDYGLFRQDIVNGRQVEQPDDWKRHGNPWEIELTEECIEVPINGRVIFESEPNGNWRPRWIDTSLILAKPFDIAVVGYAGQTVNTLRLFSAHAVQEFDMHAFDEGRFVQAVHQRDQVQTITEVLYPNDMVPDGPELRLTQEYFLVACSLRDILTKLGPNPDLRQLPSQAAIHLNDTHPSLSVPELMRILVDEHDIPWDQAWEITTAVLSFTNHTLMPEALERWPVSLMERILPRHLQILYEINRRLLAEVAAKYPGDTDRIRRMSLFEEGAVKKARMLQVAVVGSHAVNGVAKMHSELIKTQLLPDFYQLTPQKFSNKTNGVTPRRWLLQCNPDLASLLTETLGSAWITDLAKLKNLESHADDPAFQNRLLAIKRKNKDRLSNFVKSTSFAPLDPTTLFDVQIKRIHEYKRQLLHLLYVVHQYLQITDGQPPAVPRTHIFAGKAAPGYEVAKQIIYLINAVGDVINRDPKCRGLLRVIFVPDYRVTVAERIIPAGDLSEQISTAGTEASGTSNMKLAMNGALTVGTLDGANVEIRDAVGDQNIFIFGNHADQLDDLRRRGVQPRQFYDQNPTIRRVLDAFNTDILSPGRPGLHAWVFHRLVDSWDPFFLLADFAPYIAAQDRVTAAYRDPQRWIKTVILNIARTGYFSSDRTVAEYARDTWQIAPVNP
jgi:starch phosphorylase